MSPHHPATKKRPPHGEAASWLDLTASEQAALWLDLTGSKQAALERKEIPAVLHAGVVAALAPTDYQRLRFVADDESVRAAWHTVEDAHRRVLEALPGAAASPEGAAAHRQAAQTHQRLVREVLEPAVIEAEARRERVIATHEPDPAALAKSVLGSASPARVEAVFTLLRRKPHWRDAALWSQPDTARYLAHTVASEARFIGTRRRRIDAPLPRPQSSDSWPAEDGREVWGRVRTPAKQRGDRRDSSVERKVEGREEAAQRRQWLLDQCQRHNASPALKRAVSLMLTRDLSIAEALRSAGVPRSVFQNWVARVGRAGPTGFTTPARKTGRAVGV